MGILAGSAAVAVAVGTLVNAVVVRVALGPLHSLEEAARAVGAGDLGVRAGTSPLADRDLHRVMVRFDAMLDSLERERDRQQALAARLVESEERTRGRIARRLYDDTAQRLAALLLSASLIARNPDGGHAEGVDGFHRDLKESLEGVRATARSLRPPELDDLGLLPALQAEARVLSRGPGMSVVVESDDDLPLLSRPHLVTLFRLVQGALEALGRAATDTCAHVRIESGPDEVRCRIGARRGPADARNPEGPFDPERIEELNERASWIGGEVVVDRNGTRSVSIRIRVPAAPAPEPEKVSL